MSLFPRISPRVLGVAAKPSYPGLSRMMDSASLPEPLCMLLCRCARRSACRKQSDAGRTRRVGDPRGSCGCNTATPSIYRSSVKTRVPCCYSNSIYLATEVQAASCRETIADCRVLHVPRSTWTSRKRSLGMR